MTESPYPLASLRRWLRKQSDLRPGVELQPHQQRVVDRTKDQLKRTGASRLLLLHSLGSGKGLSALAAADATGTPYTALAPASLRPTLRKEQAKFLDPATSPPGEVMSYTALGAGKQPAHPESLIADEVQRSRNPGTASARRLLAAAVRAKQVTLLSGTPVVNSPGDFAVPYQLLTGVHTTPEQFEDRYVDWKGYRPSLLARLFLGRKPTPPGLKNRGELAAALRDKVDYHQAAESPARVEREDVVTEMSPEQSDLYKAMYRRLPSETRAALEKDYPIPDQDWAKLQGFLTGPRQVGLSTLPFMRGQPDPLKAFDRSPKLRAAFDRLKATLDADPKAQGLVFSNFVDAGLTPYQAALRRANIPAAAFTGKLNDVQRKQLEEDYNSGKIRAALVAPSGTEGLSFKGTRLVQLLDPHWNDARSRQSEGRALRFDSHQHLPPEARQVKIERYLARLPSNVADRLLRQLRLRPEDRVYGADDYLLRMADRKEQVNRQLVDLLREVGSERSSPP